MSYTPPGITFDGKHSYTYYTMWLSERPDYGSPEPKLNTVDVPGMDGSLDFTEANSGEVKYSNRHIVLTFATMVPWQNVEDWKDYVMKTLHGKVIERIIPDEDPTHYYRGRATVHFIEMKPWKLKCVVEIDAYPYALNVDKTVVNLKKNTQATLVDIVIPAENVYPRNHQTDLRLGTKTFPGGIILPQLAAGVVIIKWSPSADVIGSKTFTFYDNLGNSYHDTFSGVPVSAGEVRIPLSTLTSAGIELDKVWRVHVGGIGHCTLHGEMDGWLVNVFNSRMTVMPEITYAGGQGGSSSMEIMVNGETFTINDDQALYDGLVLHEGYNQIIYPLATFDTLKMTFREGRL